MIKCRPGQRLVAWLIPHLFNTNQDNRPTSPWISLTAPASPEKCGLQRRLSQPTRFRGTTRLSGGHGRFLRGDVVQALHHQPGFTLIELLVTLAVAGVLLVIGVPGFKEFIDANTLSASVNGFTADLLLTRSEAIKRNHRVTLCASANGTSCATRGGWEQGRLIYADANQNGALDSGETIIQVMPALGGGLTLRGSDSNCARAIAYGSSGHAVSFTSGFKQIIACDARAKDFSTAELKANARVIMLRTVGSMNTLKGNDSAVSVSSCAPT